MFTIENEFVRIKTSEYGATLVSIEMKNRHGKMSNILLTLDDAEAMKNDSNFYFGKTVGPIANRIKSAKVLDLEFEPNNGPNLNHSGKNGWSTQKWQGYEYHTSDVKGVRFELLDKVSGFNEQKVVVDYQLRGNALTIEFSSEAVEDTFFNPTNHAYWNLSDNTEYDIKSQYLKVQSQYVLAVDSNTLPTGEILAVKKTGFDFTKLTKIGDNLLKLPTGLDHTFVLEQDIEPQLVLIDDKSGRKVSFSSNRQAVVLYSASAIENNNEVIVNGKKMESNLGLAIEFQEQPDVINHPEWGSIFLPANKNSTKYVTMVFEQI